MNPASRQLGLATSHPDRSTRRIHRSAGRVLLALASFVTLAGNAMGATFYVNNQNPSANDAGPGTLAEPYRTISAAVNQRGAAGNTIEVLPGTYREQVSVSASGLSGSPFVIRASGPGVIIEGSESFATAGQWTLLSGNVWRASSVTWAAEQVFADGQRLTPAAVAPGVLPSRSFVYVAGQGLYANVGGGNPGTHGTLVGRHAYGFTLPARMWVNIEGFDIRRSDTKGIFASGAAGNCVLQNNSISLARLSGIHVSAGSSYVVAGNRTFNNGDHGIFVTGGVTGSVIRDNDSYGNARLGVRAANGIHLFGAPGNRVERNRVHENQDTGLTFRSGSNDNFSIQNRSWNNGDHGFDHLTSTGVTHIHDVSYGNLNDGFSFESSSLNGRVFDCIGVNNGITTSASNLFVDATSSAAYTSDYNLFWNNNPTTPVRIGSISYATLAAYTAATGRDAHSVQADPRFVNPAAGDFHLLPASPALDAATSAVAGWPALDAEGRARFDVPTIPNSGAGPVAFADIGAFELVEGGGGGGAPIVSAPALVRVQENQKLEVAITAIDPDGDAIASLTADLSKLPAGHNARFQANDTRTAGTLTWTPTYSDSGRYPVTFRASNALAGTAVTVIHVLNVDRAPVVSSPANFHVTPGTLVTFKVRASDPDGDKIQSLVLDTSRMPANSGASFVVNATKTEGTFSWTPASNTDGNFKAQFRAANALVGTSHTNIHVKSDKGNGKDKIGGLAQDEAAISLPQFLALSPASPNPSHGAVDFVLDLPRSSPVQWAVFDVQGRTVWSEERGFEAGTAMLHWPGTNGRGEPIARGLYFARVRVGETRFIRRVVRM